MNAELREDIDQAAQVPISVLSLMPLQTPTHLTFRTTCNHPGAAGATNAGPRNAAMTAALPSMTCTLWQLNWLDAFVRQDIINNEKIRHMQQSVSCRMFRYITQTHADCACCGACTGWRQSTLAKALAMAAPLSWDLKGPACASASAATPAASSTPAMERLQHSVTQVADGLGSLK